MEINNLKIRKAKEGDYSAANNLYHVTYDMYHEKIPSFYKKQPSQTLPKGTYLNMIHGNESLVFVAEADKNVVGLLYAEIEKEEGDKWVYPRKRVRIEEIAVLPEFSRKGIGKRLLQEAEKWAKKKKISDLILLTYAFNEGAIRFYETHGYEPYSIEMNKKI